VTKSELLDMHGATRMPLVLLGEHEFDGRYDHITIDNVQAAKDAVAHLVSTGRSRIAAIGSQPTEEYATPLQRESGYAEALAIAGLPVDPQLVKPAGHYSRIGGYRAAEELLALDPRPDAIFCFSDLLAIGAMRAVFDSGLRVPEDVAVIGIDDVEEGRFARPSLSTVSLDMPFLAREAVRRIVARIDDAELPAEEVVVPHRLIARESTALAN
jgi:DNA-binding LacI/PurR family transcriptional regulator